MSWGIQGKPALSRLVPLILTAAALAVGPGLAGPSGRLIRFLVDSWPAARRIPVPPGGVEVFTGGFAFPLVLIGVVSAWMLYAHANPLPQRLAEWLGPFTRLGRNRLYLDELERLFVILPIRAAGHVCRFVEFVLTGPPGSRAASKLGRLVVKVGEPLRNSVVQLDALALMLSIAVLLAALVWVAG